MYYPFKNKFLKSRKDRVTVLKKIRVKEETVLKMFFYIRLWDILIIIIILIIIATIILILIIMIAIIFTVMSVYSPGAWK